MHICNMQRKWEIVHECRKSPWKERNGGTVGGESRHDNKGLEMIKVYYNAFMKHHSVTFVQMLIKYVFNILYCIFPKDAVVLNLSCIIQEWSVLSLSPYIMQNLKTLRATRRLNSDSDTQNCIPGPENKREMYAYITVHISPNDITNLFTAALIKLSLNWECSIHSSTGEWAYKQ